MEDSPSRTAETPAKDWSAKFKASELKPSRSALAIMMLLFVVPLFGPWYVELPLLALFAVPAYLNKKSGALTKL
jgi:hypothetical protein